MKWVVDILDNVDTCTESVNFYILSITTQAQRTMPIQHCSFSMCEHIMLPDSGLGGAGVTGGPGSPIPALEPPTTVTLYCRVGFSPVTTMLVSVDPAIAITTPLFCRFLKMGVGVSVIV